MNKATLTRLNILQKSFELVYKNGYQATSIDDIIATMKVTKGAFFYHFKSKDEMGLAMVKEVMRPGMYDTLIIPLVAAEDPLTAIYEMMEGLLSDTLFFDARYGCPAMSMIAEMAPVNESFREELGFQVKQWQEAISSSLENGRKKGIVKQEVHPDQVALFLTSSYAGIRNTGKVFGREVYDVYLKELKIYLEQLRCN